MLVNTRSHQSSLRLTVRRLAVAAVTFGMLCAAAPASAQLVRIGASVGALEPGGPMRGTDTAYDPVYGVYLLVTGNGPIFGVFVNSLGLPVSAAFLIMDGSGWGHFPRAEYSPDVFGGQGGFLVTWHHNIGVNCVFGRLVSVSAGGVASGIVQISDGTQGGSWWETGAAMAYSRTSRRFLVAWRTAQYGILGRLVDFNGGLASTIIPLENAFGSRDPSLAWNPATDEFGLASTGFGASAFAAFRRVRASDGAVSARTTFGFGAGTFATAIDVNAWTNQYVMAWSLHPGTMTATFDPFGNQVATNFVTGRLGHDQSLGLAFNASSGTFLAVGSDHYSAEIAAVEVKGGGAPNSVADIITNGASARGGSYYPLTTAQAGTNQWDVVYSRDFRGATSQIIATTSTGGGAGGGELRLLHHLHPRRPAAPRLIPSCRSAVEGALTAGGCHLEAVEPRLLHHHHRLHLHPRPLVAPRLIPSCRSAAAPASTADGGHSELAARSRPRLHPRRLRPPVAPRQTRSGRLAAVPASTAAGHPRITAAPWPTRLSASAAESV